MSESMQISWNSKVGLPCSKVTCLPRSPLFLEGLVKALHIAPESALVSQIKRLLGDVYFAQQKYDQATLVRR